MPSARADDNAPVSIPRERRLADDEALEIATDAYVFTYPLVVMDVARRVQTNVSEPGSLRAPMNQFVHSRGFPDATFIDVVRPNTDTLFSMLWFDVSREPLVISVPASHDRYYLLSLLDMWTDVFAAPGTRTTGSDAYRFAIVGPRWEGPLPDDVEEIRTPTELGWIIGRTQTNGEQDYDAVHAFQRGLSANPLSAARHHAPPIGRVDSTLDMGPPWDQVARMDAVTFWNSVAGVSGANPPHADDYPILHRMRRLGLLARRSGAPTHGPAPTKAGLEAGAERGLERIVEAANHLCTSVNGWSMMTSPVGTYGTDYLRRAAVALFELGANAPEDAFYPFTAVDANGSSLDSGGRYVIHFERDEAPPARAFWSVAMYNERHAFAANPIHRYAIGDRDDLRYNADGSLDLYLQRTSPGVDAEDNWLPTPTAGLFSLVMRIYWPEQRAIDGGWAPPPVRRVE